MNRAALAFPVDVWCCTDNRCFNWVIKEGFEPREMPLVMPPGHVTKCEILYSLGPQISVFLIHDPDMLSPIPSCSKVAWRNSTTGVALCFAWNRFLAKRNHDPERFLDIYGMDMEGEADFDGSVRAENGRQEHRWNRERKEMQQVFAALTAQDVVINRHQAKSKPSIRASTTAR